ncbi:MAG: carbohydrate-binding protein [Gemmatimonadota bacterium]|nr:carbohydrate-binding protein [Gemmatimonadota bacterium]
MATRTPPRSDAKGIFKLFRRAEAAERRLVGPIRGEVLGADRLAKHARNIARKHRLLPPKKQRGPGPLLLRLDDSRRVLDEVHDRLADSAERGVDISPAGEWLLDNSYIVQEQIREIRTNLPGGYYQELPKLANGTLAEYPRVYDVAIELIAHTEGHLSLENITLFVREYQKVATLRMGELWAIPTMLRLGLVENIRRMTLRVAARLDEVEVADKWAARLMAANEKSTEALTVELKAFIADHPPFTPTFVTRFLHQMRGYQANFTPLIWLEQWIAEEGPTAEEAVTRSNRRIAATQVTVANCITSLRTISRLDWKDFVESQSATEKILRKDATGDYPKMAFATRDHYRHIVENIAKRTRMTEESVATAALGLAAAASKSAQPRLAHVGYYLVDEGRYDLERETGYSPSLGEKIYRWTQKKPNALYFGGITIGTVGALVVMFRAIDPHGIAGAIMLLLALIPASEIGISIMNQLTTMLMPPRTLPKLEFREKGILEPYKTAVVVPTLFGSVKVVKEALEHIEVQYLANRDPNLSFTILSDFTDAPTETRDTDGEIVEAAISGTRYLNLKYSPDGPDIFYLFHRPRLWNPKQGVWMGWERKRGKLGQFNRFLRGQAADAFSTIVGDTKGLEGIKYVLTLDSDTVLPREAAQMLVGTIAHPLNRAEYDPDQGRIVRGYGILQPRVGVSLTSAHASHFAAIHSGHPGVDPYTTAVSDVYQDLFSEGSFTGKGIYEVDAFEEATHGRFPENALLSHDLIEGAYARAALATDIEVYDDYPARYLTYTRRKHRWIRGDWQLLQWLRNIVPGPEGPTPNRLSAISRWKISDNLRRSLIEISLLTLLIAGWLFLPGSPAVWTALILGAIAFPWVFSLLLASLRPPRDQSWPAYYAAVARDAGVSMQQFVLAVTFLPHQAVVSADAIIRTLIRLGVTKRNLLEWQTASQVERAMSRSRLEVWRRMWPVVLIALLVAAAIAVEEADFTTDAMSEHLVFLGATLPLIALWLASPQIALALSAPATPREFRLSESERTATIRYAMLHWNFFEQFVTEETQWLAPDNFQEDPDPVIAGRTSPTNVGLQCLAIVSAFDLGFITLEGMIERLERVFRSLERMRRYRGHFYNWYNLGDLRVLEPAYISTVDSGNLAGHLLALKQACNEIIRRPDSTPGQIKRLQAIAERSRAYVLEMDFKFLFDDRRKLFSIGYQHSTNSFDNSYYDLLASESRLASFIAIAKDDVSVDHWFKLGRSLTSAGGTRTLISWSGSMFEYLMPALVLRTFPSTLLKQTHHGAVRRQISYGIERGVPWGISESAYNVRDRNHTYQYRGFGVPDLALKRGLSKELVVAPYATALALMVEPHQAVRNLSALEAEGALGPYGFRDAIDYTRPLPGHRKAVIGAYMAHHVGMSLVAFDNALKRNIWQERFHSDPLVRSAELILQERIPRRLVLQDLATQDDFAHVPSETEKPAVRELDTANTPQPRIAILGSVPYTSIISNSGAGLSQYGPLAVNRWRNDGTRDNRGQWCYVKDLSKGRLWSAGHQPVCAEANWYRVLFASDRVTFIRRDGDIETQMEIAVASDDAAEVRRVIIYNRSSIAREIELTSYAEIVMQPLDVDRSHPAFGNLFVQTEWLPDSSAILAVRRPRSVTEKVRWCGHVAAVGASSTTPVTCETDRARFIGRGRSTRDPVALDAGAELSGTVGAVLDPIFSLRAKISIAPGRFAEVTFTTFVAEDRETAIQLADLYHDPYSARRALDLSWAQAQAELRELGISPADAALYQELAGHLMYTHPGFRGLSPKGEDTQFGQDELWAMGISGDWPILLATLEAPAGLSSVRQLLRVHQYWRLKGITCDLVILSLHPPTYLQELADELLATVLASSESGFIDRPGGVYIRRADLLKPEDVELLYSIARIQVDCDGLGLGNFLEFPHVEDDYSARVASAAPEVLARELVAPVVTGIARPSRPVPAGVPAVTRISATPSSRIPVTTVTAPEAISAPASADPRENASVSGDGLRYFNGIGGYNERTEYEIRIAGGTLPPAPWVNVIGNPTGGFCISESGCGATWATNSSFRLTPWHNDPVEDPTGECIYIRDDDSGNLWTPTPEPIRESTQYTVKHGAGYSVFEHEHDGLATSLRVGMPNEDPLKISVLTLTNNGTTLRRLSITSYIEWLLGTDREKTQQHIRTKMDEASSTMLAHSSFDPQFSAYVAFNTVSEPITTYTAARREFLGRNGTHSAPAALSRDGMTKDTGDTIDPCSALQMRLELAPGETHQVVMLLGACAGENEARRLAAKYRAPEIAVAALDEAAQAWRNRLDIISVKTPDPRFDLILNDWALYQALSSRMWARLGLYQWSGAYGFRDQLQDVMAFVYSEPELAREHILRSASRQFEEGDVQHWWHPQSGRGIRTRFSDDLVWLPYVVNHYVSLSGETSVFDEKVPYLKMRQLNSDEAELYDLPEISGMVEPLYDHCVRALRRACTIGEHGLPLIGSGDWNDGMNRVGIDGRGESVWLAWFLIATLRKFAEHAEARGDQAVSAELVRLAADYSEAVERAGWDGAWYRRAYFDDGSPLGSSESDDCKIDSIAQSWSVISRAGESAHTRMAMKSLNEHLVREDARLIMLLTPPFTDSKHDPGYIQGYLPGVRENGAQYTHAALWAVLATALQGDGNRAFELYQMINPLTHAATPEGVAQYKVEPYVVAADVYTAEGHLGRGGWTWYTGSGSWMYRVGLEAILGFTKRGNTLEMDPCIPASWPEFSVTYRCGSSSYLITVRNPHGVERGVATTTLDGTPLSGSVPLSHDGESHEVIVTLGLPIPPPTAA